MSFKENQNQGFTLVETLVSVTLFVVVILAVYSLMMQTLKLVSENKFKMSAVTLADQKMEKIRNLPYTDVGTLSGVVTGVIPDNEIISNGNGSFEVNTLVLYKDDPFDGTQALGTDMLPTDYKEVRVRIRYIGPFGQREVVIYSKIAPRALETSAGGGTLEVKVINASGLPVLSADVNIRNASTTPVINFTAQTDTTGTLTLYGAKASIENYQITASKAGYSLSSTTARTASNPNPTLVNQSVFVDQKTSITLSIDQVSTLNIHTIKQTVPHNFMINTDGGTENQVTPRMAIDSAGNMVVVWQDFRVGSNGKIWSQKYDAAGNKIWASDIVISPANNQILPDIACDGSDNIYYVWNDDSNGNQDIFLVKRDKDGNNLWSGAKDVNNQAGNKDQIKARVAIATSSDRIAIAWQDNRNSDADIFFKLFNANDRSDLLTPEVRISTTTIGDGTNQQNPQIAFDNDNFMYIVWTDGRSGNNDIYAQKYDSSGVKQWTNDILINSDGGTGAQIAPAIAAGTSSLFVVWQDDRNGNQDIYARRIGSDGVKLWSSDTMINTDGGNTNQTSPAIAINKTNNELYIVWTDERNSNQDIYAQKINGNDGAAIWSSDVRANINTGSSAQYSPSVTWNAVEGKPYASWQDDRNGNSDIYATDFDQYGSITNISGVNVHIVGTKQIGDNPVIYKYDKIHTSDANGLIALPNMEWDSYNLSLSGITTFTIQTTDPATPVPLAPNTTTNVTVILK